MFVKNNRGFSLVEIMIVAAMLGGLSLVVMNLTKQSTKSSVKFQFDTEINLITNEINAILSDPTKCSATFASTAAPSNIFGKYFTTSSGSAPASGYGNAGLNIASYSLSGSAPNGVLAIVYKNKNILKGSTGAAAITKNINIYFEGTVGAITKCRSLSTSTTDIWTHGAGSDIYYYGGAVGIGTASPERLFEVKGTVQATQQDIVGTDGGFRLKGPTGNTYSVIQFVNNAGTEQWNFISATPNGNVGIGTTAPATNLDVMGGIRPGSSGVTTGGACSPEGTFAYDIAAHSPVYCNNMGTWAAMGGGGGSPAGTLCGAHFGESCGTGWRNVILCNGHDPLVSCPSGYNRWYGGTGYCSVAYYCVLN